MDPINDPDERDRNVPPTDFADSESAEPVDAAEPTEVEEQADGSATVKFDDEDDEAAAGTSRFMDNLAETFKDGVLSSLATRMLDAIDRDKESRKERDKQYAEGIKRTGLGNEAPGGASFDGASRAVHPVLIEGCVEFSARAMKELFPPNGPVKTAIIGPVTDEKLQKAERKKTYMNWQLTRQIKEYRSELEQTLTQTPLGGSQYLKVWRDDRVERPRVEFVPVDDMLLPFAASDFETAERKTHVQTLTTAALKSRIASGLYRDVENLGGGSMTPDQTASEKASAKVEGKEESGSNEDGLRTVYECYCELELEDDKLSRGAQRGYILTIDEDTRQVLALYRNWDEDDKRKAPETLAWIVEFGFIPWRGAYKIGLSHIIGSLSGALTGALRAILDSAHLQNVPGGVMLKGARQTGKTISGEPTQFTQLDAPPNVDDIRKVAMPYPFNGPSPMLFNVLQWLTEQAKGVVTTASEAIKNAGPDMPVGTALALIEQGSITYSAIHSRLHASQRKVLEILHRINGSTLQDEETVEELGSLVVRRADFEGPMDVMPVSDPNIFSDAQRYAQNQAALQMAEKFPGAFKLDKLISRAMQLIHYPDYAEVMNVPSEAKELEDIVENSEASKTDSQLKPYPQQDHLTHIKTHVHFLVSPIFCANPMMSMPAMPKLLQHVKEHLLLLYKQHSLAATEATKVVMGAKGGSSVQGAAFADQELAKELAPLMPLIEQALEMVKKFAPQPPPDPKAAASIKINSDKLAYQSSKDAQDRQQAAAEAQAKAQSDASAAEQKQALEAAQMQAETARSTQEMQVAAHNADLAERSEAENRRIDLIIEHMKQDAENLRAAQAQQTALYMAEIKAGRESDQAAMDQDFQQYSAHVQRQFDLMQALLTQKNASASDAANKQIAGGSAKTKWTIKRHPVTGDIESLEQE